MYSTLEYSTEPNQQKEDPMFIFSELDDLTNIKETANMYAFALLDVTPEDVEMYRAKIELVLKNFDGQMTALILTDDNSTRHLTNWASRMNSCRIMLAALDRNLPFKGKPQWNQSEVVHAMSLLEAFKFGAKSTLMTNGADG